MDGNNRTKLAAVLAAVVMAAVPAVMMADSDESDAGLMMIATYEDLASNTWPWNTYQLEANITLGGDYTIPDNSVLYIPHGYKLTLGSHKLTVPDATTLKIEGVLDNSGGGTIDVQGKMLVDRTKGANVSSPDHINGTITLLMALTHIYDGQQTQHVGTTSTGVGNETIDLYCTTYSADCGVYTCTPYPELTEGKFIAMTMNLKYDLDDGSTMTIVKSASDGGLIEDDGDTRNVYIAAAIVMVIAAFIILGSRAKH